jgi:exopolysaccharide biosynthesis polyprenyl glycosylphosphotransferase
VRHIGDREPQVTNVTGGTTRSARATTGKRGAPVDARDRQGPFARNERAIRAGLSDDARAALAEPQADDPFAALLALARPRPHALTDVPDEHSEGLREVRRRERIYRRLLVLADSVVAAVAVLVAIDEVGAERLRPLYLLVVPLIVLAAKVGGLYDKDELVVDHSTLNELPRLLNLATMFALLVWLVRHYLVIGAPTTLSLLLLWILLSAGLVVGRSLARALARRIAPVERCILVGRRDVFARLNAKFSGYTHLRLVGAVSAADIATDPAKLHRIAQRGRVHRIIVDTDATSAVGTLDLVRAANATGLQVSLLPSMLGAVGSSVVFDDVGGLMLMGVPRFGLSRSSRALKRAFDLAASAVAILVCAPLLIAIAVAVKLDSHGPVLFRQMRMGRGDTPFEMLKFRSMIDGADGLKESLRHRSEELDGLFKIDGDPRITRVGWWLRRTGLDELPQLFNVLAGSMSLVGPRPLVMDEDRHVKGYDRRRLHLTPGITGRWQTLSGPRLPLSEMVKIDYLYIANWSPWLDVKIIVETVGFLVHRRGK